MRRKLATALGSLALGWLAGPALAQERIPAPIISDPSRPVIIQQNGAPIQMNQYAGPVMTSGDYAEGSSGAAGGFGSGIIGGIGFYHMKPHFESNPAFRGSRTQTNGTAVPPLTTTTGQTVEFDYDTAWAPRLWLGFVSESGLGIRAGWWRWKDDAAAGVVVNPNPPGTSSSFSTASTDAGGSVSFPITSVGVNGGIPNVAQNAVFDTTLEVNVWDLEALATISTGSWGFLVSGGVRYAEMNQDYNGRLRPVDFGHDQVGPFATALSSRSFQGWGPTVALEGRYQIGDTPLALYGIGRGSILFGKDEQSVVAQADLRGVAAGFPEGQTFARAEASAFVRRDSLLPIAELEAGAQCSPGDMGGMRPLLRVGVVAQSWFGGGNASSQAGDFGFIGWTASAGFTF